MSNAKTETPYNVDKNDISKNPEKATSYEEFRKKVLKIVEENKSNRGRKEIWLQVNETLLRVHYDCLLYTSLSPETAISWVGKYSSDGRWSSYSGLDSSKNFFEKSNSDR